MFNYFPKVSKANLAFLILTENFYHNHKKSEQSRKFYHRNLFSIDFMTFPEDFGSRKFLAIQYMCICNGLKWEMLLKILECFKTLKQNIW